jgi:hypothetical protein
MPSHLSPRIVRDLPKKGFRENAEDTNFNRLITFFSILNEYGTHEADVNRSNTSEGFSPEMEIRIGLASRASSSVRSVKYLDWVRP